MKKILEVFLFIFILILPLKIIAQTNTHSLSVAENPYSRPYLVDIIDENGNIESEINGTSKSLSPLKIARELGANPNERDIFSAFPDIQMRIGSKITMYRTPTYYLVDGKKKSTIRSWKTTVGELLAENKTELGKDDKINFSEDSNLEPGTTIVIIRVARTTIDEFETIAFKTVKKNDPTMEKGNKVTDQKGKSGQKKLTYDVVREDGVQISKTLKSTEVTLAPVNEIVRVGTKVSIYGVGKASWYDSKVMEAKEPYFAAHKTLPKGTEVWVVNTANGKGVKCVILDRVGANVAIDLSPKAFSTIASLGAGIINVRIEKYYPPD